MKKNFSQPFDHSRNATIYFLVEVRDGKFVHFGLQDELGLDYYNCLKFEADKSIDFTSQIVKYLYENGLSLNSYRELARETETNFAFVDDTSGYTKDMICLHTYADEIDNSQASLKNKYTIITLDEMMDASIEAPDMPRAVRLGIAQMFSEQEAFDQFK